MTRGISVDKLCHMADYHLYMKLNLPRVNNTLCKPNKYTFFYSVRVSYAYKYYFLIVNQDTSIN